MLIFHPVGEFGKLAHITAVIIGHNAAGYGYGINHAVFQSRKIPTACCYRRLADRQEAVPVHISQRYRSANTCSRSYAYTACHIGERAVIFGLQFDIF